MTQSHLHTRSSNTVVAWMFVLYVLFVVYGSLVPLQYVDHSLGDALLAFKAIPFLSLGVDSRADWVANGVLYVPVGFLTAVALLQSYPGLPRGLAFVLAAAFSMALGVAVEFAQMFFPPRTVSLNDLLAEAIGSLIGLALAGRFTGWMLSLFASFFGDSQRLKKLALEGYAVAYIAFALFPYDLLLSWPEVQAKLDSDSWGWWLAGNGPRPTLLGLQLLAEAALTLPFGFLLARLGTRRSAGYAKAALLGAALGVLIEIAQFFIASGISQGLSVLTRALGLGCGLAMARYSARWTADNISASLRRYTLPLAAAYVLALFEINGWLSTNWQGLGAAAQQFEQLSFIPFYYHYYTTEAKALFSLGAVCLAYVPVGVMVWAHGRSPRFAMAVSLVLAAVIEVGKLFLPPSHPDLTNLLLAAAASGFTVMLLRRGMAPAVMDCGSEPAMTKGLSPQPPVLSPRPPVLSPRTRSGVHAVMDCGSEPAMTEKGPAMTEGCHPGPNACHPGPGSSPGFQDPGSMESAARQTLHPRSIGLLLCLLVTGIWLTNFPVFQGAVILVLALSAVAVWYRPLWVFVIIPAALPVFDLAPWSGRFFLDEFDALLLVCLAVAFSRVPPPPQRHAPKDVLVRAAVGCVVLSLAISTVLGLQPFVLPDANAFNNHFSPYNALRLAKGAVWALLMIALARRFTATGLDARRPFAWGMVAGLALTVLVIVWERTAFSAVWDFADDYRVTGPFSAMHTGGAYVDGYLAAAMPFLMLLAFKTRRWSARIGGVLLMLATTYALMVSFSRGGYLSFGVAVGLAVAVVLCDIFLQKRRVVRGGLVFAAAAGALVLVALPIFKGEFVQARLNTTGTDLAFRQARWQDTLALRDAGWPVALFGMGLGRYPETKYWRSTLDAQMGTYQLKAESGNTYLRLGSGDPIGLDQFVAVVPGQSYVLKLDVRPSKPGVTITVPVCEKWLLTSANCVVPGINLGDESGAWRSVQVPFTTTGFDAQPWYSHKPVKLALTYAGTQSTLDIDNIKLESADGQSLLRNGDFSNGLDHWFMATSGPLHVHWRTHSLFYGVLFDQGWFGLLALAALAALAIGHAARHVWRGVLLPGAALAALSGFLAGGFFDTQIDTPRFLLLLGLLAWACF